MDSLIGHFSQHLLEATCLDPAISGNQYVLGAGLDVEKCVVGLLESGHDRRATASSKAIQCALEVNVIRCRLNRRCPTF